MRWRGKDKAELDRIFASYEARQLETERALSEQEKADAAFIQAFLEKRDSVIRPAMEEFGQEVRRHGWMYEITTDEGGWEERARGCRVEKLPSIQISFYKGERRHRADEFPHLGISAQKRTQKVSLYERAMWPTGGGQSGPAGDLTLEQVTSVAVHGALLGLLKKLLTR